MIPSPPDQRFRTDLKSAINNGAFRVRQAIAHYRKVAGPNAADPDLAIGRLSG